MSQLSFTFLIGAFIIYGVWGIQMGDYPSYAEIVQDVYNRGKYLSDYEDSWLSHMEPIYNWLAIQCKGNIHLWRLVWFTVQWLGMGYMLWKLKVNNYEAILVFILLVFYSVNSGRVSWGIGYFFLSLYLFLSTHQKRYLLFLVLSYWAHTSMILLFSLLPILLVKFNRNRILVVILLIPVLVSVMNYVFDEFLLVNQFDNEYLNRKLNTYGNNEFGASIWGETIVEFISVFIYRFPLYVILYIVISFYLKLQVHLKDSIIRYFSFVFILFIYTCCAYFSNLKSGSFFNRYLMMLYLPSFVLIFELGLLKHKLLRRMLLVFWYFTNSQYLLYLYYSLDHILYG